MEDVKALHDQKKSLLPDSMPHAPPSEAAAPPLTNGDVKMTDVDESHADVSIDLAGSDHDGGMNGRPRKKLKRSDAPAVRKQASAAEAKEEAEKEVTLAGPKNPSSAGCSGTAATYATADRSTSPAKVSVFPAGCWAGSWAGRWARSWARP